MNEEKKKWLSLWEKLLLLIAVLIILYFLLGRMGISPTSVIDQTEITDPYR